jgi:hypothetical protein
VTNYGALFLHLTVVALPWIVAAIALAHYREQRRVGRLVVLGATVLIAGLLTARFAAHCHSLLWLRSLSAEQVAAISLAGKEVTDHGGRGRLVAALRQTGWYFRTGGLGQGRPLNIRLTSGEQILWQLYSDPNSDGAVILLWSGAGANLGELFCAPLPQAASALGISIR